MIDHLKLTAEGIRTLKDWLGAGGQPVPSTLAESRAAICQMCPLNVGRDWWWKHEDVIALTIRKWLSLKEDLHLKLPDEQHLGMCQNCGCCLKLKPFVPIEHIKANTSEATMRSYPRWCWVKKEIEG